MHACPCDRFNDAEGALAVIKGEEDRRHLSDMLGKRAVPDEVADDAEQFREHHADDLSAMWHGDPSQLLHCGAIGKIVHYSAQVIDAVGVWNVSVPGLALTHLFSSAVVEADFRNDVDDLFAIELQSEP